ncbi:MAG: FkbM family methyltransferase [Nitrospira sp.]|nr:FkbM family methyltransferase [Nitrospira sp.]
MTHTPQKSGQRIQSSVRNNLTSAGIQTEERLEVFSTNHQGYILPDLVYSVCSSADIGVWSHTSKNLLNFVPSKNYLLIVPDSDVELFKTITDRTFKVVPESVFVPGLKEILRNKIPPSSIGRIGWYLQQFIKLSVLKEARDYENFVIWDADTVPLKKIEFFRSTGEVEFFTGTEAHLPYFDLTQKLMGFGKRAKFSFIAQCFPYKGIWANNFFNFIEGKFSESYEKTLLNLIDFKEGSGFSEYETLGSFAYHNYRKQIIVSGKKWERNGTALIGGPHNIYREPYKQLIKDYEHLTFERWQEPFSTLKAQDDSARKSFLSIESYTLPKLETYLDDIFLSDKVRTVVQIGANDGVQNDPLRKYLKDQSALKVQLIEPIPYYVEKLQQLYFGRSDITVRGVAAGSAESMRELFFIRPEVADEMNGDGPKNDWAHGQGSFDKATVIHWIKQNSFQGKKYVANIDHYVRSITSINVNVVRTDSLLEKNRCGLLLVIDVQGFESEVLDGIDWLNPPEWIVIEDDLGKSFDHIAYFAKHGFRWVAGEHDKVFSRLFGSAHCDLTARIANTDQFNVEWIAKKIKTRAFLKKVAKKLIPTFAQLLVKRILGGS